ncbi:MAG TPA: hypothetical protein VE267_08725 [Bradyrhizobium sp.]|nr:hypothetical protein [Bradyrhizobium sp.]
MNSILPSANQKAAEPDVLVGAGIMSATLGVLLKEVEPPNGTRTRWAAHERVDFGIGHEGRLAGLGIYY